MCFLRSDLKSDISPEEIKEIIENGVESDPEEEEDYSEDNNGEQFSHDCPDCIKRKNEYLLERLNHVLKKCGEEEMDEAEWSELRPVNQMRVFLYVNKLKEATMEKDGEGKERPVPDELEEEFKGLVASISTSKLQNI